MSIEPKTTLGPKVDCPHCGEKTEGRLNNRKELRCMACWGVLPPPPVKDELATQVPMNDPDLQTAIKAQNEPPKQGNPRRRTDS